MYKVSKEQLDKIAELIGPMPTTVGYPVIQILSEITKNEIKVEKKEKKGK